MKSKLLASFLFLSMITAYGQDKDFPLSYSIETIRRDPAKDATQPDSVTKSTQVFNLLLETNDSFEISTPKSTIVTYYDLQNELIVMNTKDTLYSILPLYHILDYRVAEYNNRVYLANLLKSGGLKTFGGQTNLESIFGIEIKEARLRDSISSKKVKDTTIYSVKDGVIARIHYSSKKVPVPYAGAFAKYLTYQTELHPSIKEKISQSGLLPDYIEYTTANVAFNVTRIHRLSDSKAKAVKHKEHDPAKLIWGLPRYSPMEGRIDSVLKEVTLHGVQPLDSTVYFARSDKFSAEGNNLSALLNLFEYLLQSGHTPVARIKKIVAHQEEDLVLKKFISCLSASRSNYDVEQKVTAYKEMLSIPREYGYVMNIFLANTLGPGEEALFYFNEALKQNPLITGAYVDIGKIFASQYRYENAWTCYDIVLKMNPKHPMAKEILNRKTKLKNDFPAYFRK